jgi:hypothetical protein
MHYLSARATLDDLLTSLAARNARSRGDTERATKSTQAKRIPQGAVLRKALATPALFLYPCSFQRFGIKTACSPLFTLGISYRFHSDEPFRCKVLLAARRPGAGFDAFLRAQAALAAGG